MAKAGPPCMKKHPPGNGFRWVVESFGTNGRLTEMQSAVGLIQLGRMKEWKQKRQDNVAQILEVCRKFSGLRVPEVPDHVDHAGYRAYVFARPENLKRGWSRDRIMEQINALGVPCYVGSCSEVYREKVLKNRMATPETSAECQRTWRNQPHVSRASHFKKIRYCQNTQSD